MSTYEALTLIINIWLLIFTFLKWKDEE